MRYFLDTEFNEQGGELISIALVADIVRPMAYYQELIRHEPDGPWVAQHVTPKLAGKNCQVAYSVAGYLLNEFLQQTADGSVEIIADWPADFIHLCTLLDRGNGERYGPAFITFQLVSGMDCKPENPHHALSDAYALRAAYNARKV